MTFSGYLSENWGLLVLMIGIALILRSDTHLERKMVFRIGMTNALTFLYSVSCYLEAYFAELPYVSVFRLILSALDYSLTGFILVNVIMVMFPMQKRYLFFPAILNAVISVISIPTGVVFWFMDDNHFQRGQLGYMSFFVAALYLIYLFICMVQYCRMEREDLHLMVFITLSAMLCLLIPLYLQDAQRWFYITIAADVMMYYVLLLQQSTKRDSLTKLLNRQSYYFDSEKYMEEITAIVTMDMDGLKRINDTEGHIAGDKALKTLAECFCKSAKSGQRIYRIGGDEYVILCLNSEEAEIKELIGRIKQTVSESGYSCSVGYAMKTAGSTIDMLYQQADAMLYEDKQRYYQRTGTKR